jgi:hypothetical protein
MEPAEITKLKALDEQIQIIKTATEKLKAQAEGIQAAECNADRILASAKMLEINFSDLLAVLQVLPDLPTDFGDEPILDKKNPGPPSLGNQGSKTSCFSCYGPIGSTRTPEPLNP